MLDRKPFQAMVDDPLLLRLRQRLEPTHLSLRLGIEAEGPQPTFGQGRGVFGLERLIGFDRLIRGALKLSLLYGVGRRNALRIRLVENDVFIPRLPPAFDGFTLLHISDLHLDANEAFPAVLAERVQGLAYDACVLTGDFRYQTFGPIGPALDGLRRLRASLRNPVYAVLGNHDSVYMVPTIEDLGIRLLLNESVVLRRGEAQLQLAGVDDPHFFRADDLARACRDLDPRWPALLLAHSPEIFRQAAHAGFDLMLCGHTHGGQISLPGGLGLIYNANCPRRYCKGPWRHGAMQGYTSVGAGSSVVDVRFNCPPEITLHRLRRGAG